MPVCPPEPPPNDPGPAAVGGIGLGVVPQRRRGIEVRERLLAAALAEFEAQGAAATQVERIVARAETSWGTFFRYFPRKEDVLLLAAARHYREHVRPIIEAGIEQPTRPRREVARDAFGALTTPLRAPRLHAEMLFESVRFPLRFAAMLDEGELPFISLLASLVADAQERGEVRTDIPAAICATVLASGVVFSTVQALRLFGDQLPAGGVQGIVDLAFEAAWTGLRAQA